MSEPRPRVLVVEDEVDLAEGIRANLVAEGCEVETCGDGARALKLLRSETFELVVLDVVLPGMDGFSVCRALREEGREVPVLFLTARGDPEDRIRGLEEGGDDYLAKPFRLRELLLRVSAILRRGRRYARGVEASESLEFGGNEIDFKTYRYRSWDGTEEVLGHKEAMILKLLSDRDGEVVSRDNVIDWAWGYDAYPTRRTVDNFILRLRRRFERDPHAPRHFVTVHGVGYRFLAAGEDGPERASVE